MLNALRQMLGFILVHCSMHLHVQRVCAGITGRDLDDFVASVEQQARKSMHAESASTLEIGARIGDRGFRPLLDIQAFGCCQVASGF